MDLLKSYTFTVVDAFATLTILGQVIALFILGFLLLDVLRKTPNAVTQWIATHGLLLMCIVAVLATGGSLFFSDIAGWTPCKDCWFQRIFMYPQVILLLVAMWKRDTKIALYILILSVIGMGIAIDHYSDQVEAAVKLAAEKAAGTLEPCDATGVSCAKTEIKFAFGYITLPMMAMTAFLLNALGSITIMRRKTL